MQQAIASALSALKSSDGAQQNAAYESLMVATRDRVDWAYEVWDEMVSLLKKGDNRQRAIAAQVLCSLAKSDPQERMLKDLPVLIETTKDERFVTARHCMQSLWKVGVAGNGQRKALETGLNKRSRSARRKRTER